jgi:hypothetical protein
VEPQMRQARVSRVIGKESAGRGGGLSG